METAGTLSRVASALTWPDYLLAAASFAVLAAIAYFKGRGEADTRDFFIAKRSVPAWAACLSFVATEISALTIIGVPAAGFRENWQYLQFFIGSAVARLAIAYLFIPAFYKHDCTTIYEYLRSRFGPATQYAGSAFFFVTRLLGSAVRLYAAALAVAVIMHWSLGQAVALFTVIAIAYIAFGGIRAVVWTGVFEASLFYAAGGALVIYLIVHIQGGVGAAWDIAAEAGKLSLFNTGSGVKDPNVLWLAILNGVFGSMAAFGTDQELMQRLLTPASRENSQKAIVWTIAATFSLITLYLSAGTLLYVFFSQNPQIPPPANSDAIFSYFTAHVLPAGLRGLMLAAVLMASIDSPLGSLASSFITDIYRPVLRPGRGEKHYLFVSRLSVIGFGLVLAALAYSCRSFEGILWVAFKINGVTAGSLLGVFLLGLLTDVRVNKANVWAMCVSAALMAVLLYCSEKGIIGLGWSWLIIMGTMNTFCFGWLAGRFFPPKQNCDSPIC